MDLKSLELILNTFYSIKYLSLCNKITKSNTKY